MRQLLFLFLFPCLALAQYQGNANQKITLGEQTTADGLVWRGVASIDTVTATSKITRANKQDTSAYLLLDTVTNLLWHYKIGSNAWTQAGGGVSVTSFSAGTTGLTPSTATTGAVTLGGTLAVANGGTGVNMSSLPNNYLIRKNASGFFDTSGISSTNGNIGINTSASPVKLTITDNINLPTTQVVNTNVWMVGANSLQNVLLMDAFNQVNNIVTRRANGTSLSPTNIPSGVTIFQFSGRGYGSTGYSLTSRVAFIFSADEDFTDTNQGTRISFWTTNNGTTTQSEKMRITNAGSVGIGTTSPTGVLHLKAGTASASSAPLKFTSGKNLTTAEAGAMEFNGTNLFFSPSTTRHTVNHGLTGSATLDFPSTTTLLSADLNITVTGASDGDVVSLGVPNAAVNANTCYTAWVSAANTVTVRFNNFSSGTVNPASGLFKVFVTK